MSNKIIINNRDYTALEIELVKLFKKHSLRLDNMKQWNDLQVLESRVLNDLEEILQEMGFDYE